MLRKIRRFIITYQDIHEINNCFRYFIFLGRFEMFRLRLECNHKSEVFIAYQTWFAKVYRKRLVMNGGI